MKIAILESIVMPAGHEVEFDRILVEELKKQGHEPVFFVPQNYPFKIEYNVPVEYLAGGEAISYAGSGKIKKIHLSLQREKRRIAWFDDAYKKAVNNICDAIIVPTNSWRVMRSIRNSKIQLSPIPVLFMMHGIMPQDRAKFVAGVKSLAKYPNIHIGALGMQTEFPELRCCSNFHTILPPVYIPMDLKINPEFIFHEPLRLGFFGQYRKEKNLEFFLKAFVNADFTQQVQLTVQGATVTETDSEDFERLRKKYRDYKNIFFLHKNLLGLEWQKELMAADVILMPYGAERYRYQPSAMLFTAIGYFKPVLQSPEMSPEVLAEFNIGEAVQLDSIDSFSKQLEAFINNFKQNAEQYKTGLNGANEKYSQANMLRNILTILKEKNTVRAKSTGIAYHLNEYRQQAIFHKDLYSHWLRAKHDKEYFLPFDNTHPIPKVIHYSWFGKGEYNDVIQKCMKTWKEKLPDYEFKLWNEDNFPIEKYPFAQEAYAKKKWAFVADVTRLHALYYEGGISIDTDVEVIKSFNSLLYNDAFFCYESPNLIPSGIIASKKYHPWIALLLLWYKGLKLTDDYLEIANTRIISKITRLHYNIKLNGKELIAPHGLHIYPREFFCPEKENSTWKITDNTYAVHHFTGLW